MKKHDLFFSGDFDATKMSRTAIRARKHDSSLGTVVGGT